MAFAVLGAGVLAGESPRVHESNPLFERDIRPILKVYCFQCHGEAEVREGALTCDCGISSSKVANQDRPWIRAMQPAAIYSTASVTAKCRRVRGRSFLQMKSIYCKAGLPPVHRPRDLSQKQSATSR